MQVVSTFCLYGEDDLLDFAFTAFDTNGDEAIDMEEFQAFVEQMQQQKFDPGMTCHSAHVTANAVSQDVRSVVSLL